MSLNLRALKIFYFYFPFVGNLTASNKSVFSQLDYSLERARVTDYWRRLVSENTAFNVPEAVFNQLSRAVIPHIRMSVTKDPESGIIWSRGRSTILTPTNDFPKSIDGPLVIL